MTQIRMPLRPSDPLVLRPEPLGRLNLMALRRGLTLAVLGAAVLSTLAFAGQECDRLAASVRPALVTVKAEPVRSRMSEVVGADPRLFTRAAPER